MEWRQKLLLENLIWDILQAKNSTKNIDILFIFFLLGPKFQ